MPKIWRNIIAPSLFYPTQRHGREDREAEETLEGRQAVVETVGAVKADVAVGEARGDSGLVTQGYMARVAVVVDLRVVGEEGSVEVLAGDHRLRGDFGWRTVPRIIVICDWVCKQMQSSALGGLVVGEGLGRRNSRCVGEIRAVWCRNCP